MHLSLEWKSVAYSLASVTRAVTHQSSKKLVESIASPHDTAWRVDAYPLNL